MPKNTPSAGLIANDFTTRPAYRFLLVQSFVTALAFQGWSLLYTNYAVNIIGLSGAQNGFIQSVRELPGLLSACLVYLLLFIRETRLAALMVALTGLGTMITGFFPSFYGLMLCSFLMSLGFHYYDATTQSLTLQYFSIAESPVVIGRARSLTAAGSVISGLLIFAFSSPLALSELGQIFSNPAAFVPDSQGNITGGDFTMLYLLTGAFALLGGLWGLAQREGPNKPVQRKGMVLRKRYWLYYLLTLLSGARRQIFMVFSVFLLVNNFGFTLPQMALLFLLNNFINLVLNRFIGKAINHIGERKLLTVKYAALLLIFLAYANSGNKWLVAALYIIEQLFFNFTVAIRTFFQKMADPGDIAPSMAIGMTINHIVAVTLPIIGGALWMLDYRIPFYMGAFFALCSVICVQFIDKTLALNKLDR